MDLFTLIFLTGLAFFTLGLIVTAIRRALAPCIVAAFLVLPTAAPALPTYLTKGGSLRLEAFPETVAKLKREGWVEAPRPEVNARTQSEPQWRNGRWVVRTEKARAVAANTRNY